MVGSGEAEMRGCGFYAVISLRYHAVTTDRVINFQNEDLKMEEGRRF